MASLNHVATDCCQFTIVSGQKSKSYNYICTVLACSVLLKFEQKQTTPCSLHYQYACPCVSMLE